jgi:hypothetical protein
MLPEFILSEHGPSACIDHFDALCDTGNTLDTFVTMRLGMPSDTRTRVIRQFPDFSPIL